MALANDVAALGKNALAPHDFVLQAEQLVEQRIAFEDFCFAGLDPESVLPTWAVCRSRVPSALLPRWLEIEMTEARHLSIAEIPNRPAENTFLLSADTGGAFDRSLRYREILRPLELKHELRIVFRAHGMTWGGLALIRDAGDRDFAPEEVDLMKHMAPAFAEGVRRTFLQSATETSVLDDAPAVIILSADCRIVSRTEAAETLLAELADAGVTDPEGLPTCVRVVALRACARNASSHSVWSRARTRGGRWVTIRGAPLDGGRRVAIVIERMPPAEVASMMLAAYGLTARECEIAEHVLLGLSTQDVSVTLRISEYTVQDHLKSIFDKTGVSSRKELAARLFTGASAARES
jgi:DNA-binding CsgD family transcriptional regulator